MSERENCSLSLHATRSTGNSRRSAELVFGLIRSDLIAVLAVVGDRRLHQSRRDLKVRSCLGDRSVIVENGFDELRYIEALRKWISGWESRRRPSST